MRPNTQGPVWGIVLAAGAGNRFGEPKQFARTGADRLVDLAVRATTAACDGVVLVLPEGTDWHGPAVSCVVPGGPTRTSSVRNALTAVPAAAAITVIHQAANPLAEPALFAAVIEAVRAGAAAAVPGLPPADVVRRVASGRIVEDVGRDDLVVVQTPGAFRTPVLRAAHASGAEALEDSALVAALGETVVVVPGDPCNIHVTTPRELRLVDCLLTQHPEEGAHG